MEGKLKGRLGDILEEDRIANSKLVKPVKKVASKKSKKLGKKKKVWTNLRKHNSDYSPQSE